MKRYLLASLSAVSILFAASDKCNKECPKTPPKPVCCMFEEGCTKWYAGAGVSFADLFYFSNSQSNNASGSFFADHDSDKESTTSAPSLGYNAFIGYKYNEYFDLEVKVAQIIRPFKNSFNTDFSSTGDDDVYSGSTKLYFLSFGPYVLINMPLYHGFSPFFRFGMVTDFVEFKRNAVENEDFDTDLVISGGRQKESIWAEKFNVGIGFRSNWGDIVSLKFEYETPIANTIPSGTTTYIGDDFYIPGILSFSMLVSF